jgi:hypothetical protein
VARACSVQWICHVSARLQRGVAFKALAAKVTRNFVLFLGRIPTRSGQRVIGSFKVDRPRFTTAAWLRKLTGGLPRGAFDDEIQPRRQSVTLWRPWFWFNQWLRGVGQFVPAWLSLIGLSPWVSPFDACSFAAVRARRLL